MSDLEQLYEKAVEILRREITNLHIKSQNKLNPTDARDLVNYLKVLHEVLDRDLEGAKQASQLSTEELERIVNKT